MNRKFKRPFRGHIRSGGYGLDPFLRRIPSFGERTQTKRILYHYTNMHAFEAICRSRQIFLSECVTANDVEEIVFSAECMYTDILQRYTDHEFKDAALRDIDQFVACIPDSIFALSLTENSDLLSQWRGYGRDDGIAIGFQYRLLRDMCVSNGLNIDKVIYDGRIQNRIIPRLTDSFMDICSMSEDGDKNQRKNELMENFCSISPIIKHGAFFEEAEWRIHTFVLFNDPYDHVQRCIDLSGRRFLPIGINPKLYTEECIISEIVIGPSVNWDEKLQKVQDILNIAKIDFDMIRVSTTPFQPVRR